jgi:hypothetical protein
MIPARHPGCRIGSVTHKASGFRVVRLHDGPERTRHAIMSEVRSMLDGLSENDRPVVGFAMVMWNADGTSNAACKAYPGSSIPSIAIPDFARNRLLAEKIEEWSKP